MFILDSNVISELRRPKPDARVQVWFGQLAEEQLYLSVIVVGEMHRGVMRVERRDAAGGARLRAWLTRLLVQFDGRILPVTQRVAMLWGSLSVPDPVAAADGLLAATALAHGMTLVTRNVKDVERTGVSVLNPWEFGL